MGEWRFGGSGGRGSKLICMDAELKVSLQAIREQLEELKEQLAHTHRRLARSQEKLTESEEGQLIKTIHAKELMIESLQV